jgi:hypothetical protein
MVHPTSQRVLSSLHTEHLYFLSTSLAGRGNVVATPPFPFPFLFAFQYFHVLLQQLSSMLPLQSTPIGVENHELSPL